jgi:hypothetical protein
VYLQISAQARGTLRLPREGYAQQAVIGAERGFELVLRWSQARQRADRELCRYFLANVPFDVFGVRLNTLLPPRIY